MTSLLRVIRRRRTLIVSGTGKGVRTPFPFFVGEYLSMDELSPHWYGPNQ